MAPPARSSAMLVLVALAVGVLGCCLHGWFCAPRPPVEMARELAARPDRHAIVQAGQALLADERFMARAKWRLITRDDIAVATSDTVTWAELPSAPCTESTCTSGQCGSPAEVGSGRGA